MFYETIIQRLRNNASLADTVSEWEGRPAIFADAVPEGVEEPYIVFQIDNMAPTLGRVIMEANIIIDYFDYRVSRQQADLAGEIIEASLDSKVLQSQRLSDIRINMTSCGYIPEGDPRVVHYNMIFGARGTRRKWMTTLQ